jgi:hypothetical protein
VNWDLVFSIANKIGIRYNSARQWKSRNKIPHKWRVQIVAQSGGVITWQDFEKMDKGRKAK